MFSCARLLIKPQKPSLVISSIFPCRICYSMLHTQLLLHCSTVFFMYVMSDHHAKLTLCFVFFLQSEIYLHQVLRQLLRRKWVLTAVTACWEFIISDLSWFSLGIQLYFSPLVKRVNSRRKAIVDETMWIRVDNCAVLLTNLPTILKNIDLPLPCKKWSSGVSHVKSFSERSNTIVCLHCWYYCFLVWDSMLYN